MSNVNVKLARSGPSQTLGAVLYQGDKVLQGGYYSKLNIEHVQYGSREVIDVVLSQEVILRPRERRGWAAGCHGTCA